MRYLSLFPVAPLALAVAFAPAYAADADSTAVDKEKVEKVDAKKDDVEVVVVTGIRYSVEKAQDIKMNSEGMVDAIVAEDIGKMPDLTAAESIARIAGVQVDRYNDEATGFLIRGLPDVTTTYNGREFWTAELRRGQLQDFPSAALAGIEVYKSTTADMIEPGLAGLVNIRTRRPFDFEGEKINVGVHYGYNEQSKESSPAANVLYSNRWDTNAGEFGFLGNITYAESQYAQGIRYNDTRLRTTENTWHFPDTEGANPNAILPEQVGFYNTTGDRWRPSGNIALQWRPMDELEIYSDISYHGYRGRGATDNFWFPTGEWDWLNWTGTPNATTDVTLSNIQYVGDTKQVASLTKWGGLPPQAWRSTNSDKTNTSQVAFGAKWDNGPWHVETDLAYHDSIYQNYAWSFDTGLNTTPEVDIDFFGGQGGATFNLGENNTWNPMDINSYELRGYYESSYHVGGRGTQWRTDFVYDTGMDLISKVKFGFRVADRDARRSGGDRYAWLWGNHTSFTDLQAAIPGIEFEQTFDPIRNKNQTFTSYLQPTLASIQANHDALAAFAYEQQLMPGVANDAWRAAQWTTPGIQIDPLNEWLAKERSYAYYLQLNSHFDIFSMPTDVFAGTRLAITHNSNRGFSRIDDGLGLPNSVTGLLRDQSDTDVSLLPNLSMRTMITDKLQFRAGYTETQTKPNFADLNPSIQIAQYVAPAVLPEGYEPPDYDATGSGGNPNLKPLTSKNYDLSLEYYFSKSGYVSAAGYYRDLWGFVNSYRFNVETPDYGTVLMTHPANSGEGYLKGWELNATTFLDFEVMPEFLHNFGVSANMTRITGENRRPMFDDQGDVTGYGPYEPFRNLSKYTYNAALFYERDGFGARLSYNYRDSWTWRNDVWGANGVQAQEVDGGGNPVTNIDGLTLGSIGGVSRLDFSASYNFSDHMGIWVDVANLLAPSRPFKSQFSTQPGDDVAMSYVQDVRDEGRYFGIGFRFDY